MCKRRYTKPNRIDDIIALIQILAFANNTSRTEEGLTSDLGKPKSSEKWADVALAHREFFRYSTEGKYLSLIARYAMPKNSLQNSHAPIPNELIKEILSIAILLYDKEVKRREYWIVLAPPIIAAIPGILAIILTFSKPSERYLNYKIDHLQEQFEKMRSDSTIDNANDNVYFQNTAPKIP